jgi:hypothetical protein
MEVAMKKVKEKLTAMLNAVTFAEAGEHEAAIEYLEESAQQHTVSPSDDALSSGSIGAEGTNLIRSLEKHMTAAAFAQAGEFGAAREMLQTGTRPKAVLLVLDGHATDSDAFTHAVNLCKRIGAGMEILAFSPHVEREGTEENSSIRQAEYERVESLSRLAEKQGVTCTITVQAGNVDEQLFHYVQRHKEIAAVIYGSQSPRKVIGRDSGFQRALEAIVAKLAIPLVKVLGKRPVGAHP